MHVWPSLWGTHLTRSPNGRSLGSGGPPHGSECPDSEGASGPASNQTQDLRSVSRGGAPGSPTSAHEACSQRRLPANSERGQGRGEGDDSLVSAALYLRFLSMGSCPGDPSTPGLTPLHCRWDPGRCDLRPTGEEGLHLWPDAAAGGPNGEPGPCHTPALSGSRASGSSHPPRQQTLSHPARTQPHS